MASREIDVGDIGIFCVSGETYVKELGDGELISLNKKMDSSKDARIKYKKILEYIGQLQTYGVSIGASAIKHIKNSDLWELRPIKDRIFFAYWKDNIFVLLSCFEKKTQKTPPREIERAERKFSDFVERYGR